MKDVNLEAIRAARKQLHITLQEMATLLGFKNASTYMKYERGEYKFRAEHLPAIANRLKMKMSDIFFDREFADLAK